MNQIKEVFDKVFSRWEIKIPFKNLDEKINGFIQEKGWLIQYCFGKEADKEYMDYFAEHRMTDPRHERIYEDGNTESLSYYQIGYRIIEDDPVQTEKNKNEFYEHNKKVAQELLDKGFHRQTINTALLSGMVNDD
jgi:hypothetical protein